MIRVLFFGRSDRQSLCEYDFILNEIITKKYEVEPIFLSLNEIQNTTDQFDIFVYSCRDPQNYPWGYMPSYEDVYSCVTKIKPKIIIQLSDEFWFENHQEHNNLGHYCELFLRQYHHENYMYSMNTIHIPLGYCNDISKLNEIKKIKERKYNWSFIGEIKSDREELIRSFESIKNGFFGSGLSKNEMCEIYSDSIFAPCGRGNVTLNCFRLYETTMMGCIPVVVGNKKEIDTTFAYEENPPWIFCDTWDDAVSYCSKLLDDKDQLDSIQRENLLWWEKRLCKINKKVSHVLGDKNEYDKLKNFPPVHFISTFDSDDRRNLLKTKFDEYKINNITPHIFKRYEEGDYEFKGELIHKMTGPGRGPLSSHLRTIKGWYYGTDEPYAFFCEDDISFETVKYWNFTWEEFFNRLPKDWECVQLCWVREKYRNFLIEFRNRCWCDWSGCAYLISRKYAKKVIENYYYGDEFTTDIKGEDLVHRPEWAKIPVIETVIFSSIGKVYGFPLFVEDVINCHTTWRWGSFNEVNTYSYFETMEWWKGIGQFMNLDDIFMNVEGNLNS